MSGPQLDSAQPSPTDGPRWFLENVQTHEPQLRGYLRDSFPKVRDVDDVIQESYLRIWEARASRPIRSAKAFLFQVARNLALDLIRHENASPIAIVPSLAELPVIEERPSVAETISRREKSKLLGEALAELPRKCREIVFLHKIKGLSQRAVAEHLGLSEKTVANQIGMGVKRCERFFRQRGVEFF